MSKEQAKHLTLHIHLQADHLHFTLQGAHFKYSDQVPFSGKQLDNSIRQINQVIGASASTNFSPSDKPPKNSSIPHRGPSDLAGFFQTGHRLAFAQSAYAFIPYGIQQKLREQADLGEHQLFINTDLLQIPWEMLEFATIYCRNCHHQLAEPPRCPQCRRLLLPNERGVVTCVCGAIGLSALSFNCPGCKAHQPLEEFYAIPDLHLGLRFILDRQPSNICPAEYPPAGLDHALRVLFVENPGLNLEHTRLEQDALLRFFEKNHRLISAELLDIENVSLANLKRILAGNPPFDIIHFIGHAEFVPSDPYQSYLQISAYEQLVLADVDNFFSASPPRLVILNGCQTARVSPNQVGFPISFLRIGVQGFLGTLSTVQDPQAAELSVDLYHELLQGTGLSEALYHAKRRLHHHIDLRSQQTQTDLETRFAWAPFVTYGDAELKLRTFDWPFTWRKLAKAAARSASHLPEGDATDDLDLLDSFYCQESKPIWVALNLEPGYLQQAARSAVAGERHIVYWIDLNRVGNVEDLSTLIVRDLAPGYKAGEVLNQVHRMSTSKATFLIFITGLDETPQSTSVIEEVERVCRMAQGAVHIVLDGGLATWSILIAQASPQFINWVDNWNSIHQQMHGYALDKLRGWAADLSRRELDQIPSGKWNPATPELYVRRHIETDIQQFLERSAFTRGFCVLGETGRGKTNLFCRLYQGFDTSGSSLGHVRIPIFLTALGLWTEVGSTDVKSYLKDKLFELTLGPNASSTDEQSLQQALYLLREDANGGPIEIVFLVDAVNELGDLQLMRDFMDGLTDLMQAMHQDPVLSRSPLYLSVLVSSRSFSWHSLWRDRINEHQQFFGNLSLDENGVLAENLLDFDLSTEAREAWELAGLEPSWDELDPEFKQLCRTPFILNILRTMRQSGYIEISSGSYYDIMQRYEQSVLEEGRRGRQSLRTAGLRRAVIYTLRQFLAGDATNDRSTTLPEVIEYLILEKLVVQDGYIRDAVGCTIEQLVEESVLESRGDQLRFAFDRFFDYLFRQYLIERNVQEDWDIVRWQTVLERYSQSEYHRPGVIAALAHEFHSHQKSSSTVAMVEGLLLNKESLPSYRQLVIEALVSFGESTPENLAETLGQLHDQIGNVQLISNVAIRVMSSSRVLANRQQALMNLLAGAINSFLQQRHRRIEYRRERRNLVNTVGGLGRGDIGLDQIISLVRLIVGVDPVTHELPVQLRVTFELILHPELQNGLTQIRYRTLPHITEKSGRVSVLAHIAASSIFSPQLIWFLLRQPQLLKLIPNFRLLLAQTEISLEILVKGILSWFTERRSAADQSFWAQVGSVDQHLFRELFGPVVSVLTDDTQDPAYRQDIFDNFAFLVGIVGLWPEVNRLFSYSEEGLDALAKELQAGRGPELAEMLSLFDFDLPLSAIPDGERRLTELYLVPDSFRNYLGMLAIIIQGTKDFNSVEPILWNILTTESDKQLQVNGRAIPERAKLAREVFSVFTYMMRRADSLGPDYAEQLQKMIVFVYEMTGYLFDFERHPEYLSPLLNTELFGQEDPYNPLLPLGVACHLDGRYPYLTLGSGNYLVELVDRLVGCSYPRSYDLIDRVLKECVPVAYFAPLLVISTLSDFILQRARLLSSNQLILESITAVITSLHYISNPLVERLFESLHYQIDQQYAKDLLTHKQMADLIDRIQQTAKESPLGVRDIEYLFRSIDVFGGHDLVTTVFIEYPNLRKVFVPFLQEEITKVSTAPELVLAFLAKGAEELASPKNNFSLLRLLHGESDENDD